MPVETAPPQTVDSTNITGIGGAGFGVDIEGLNLREDVSNDFTGLNQSEYDFNYRYFPSDLAQNYNGHYMVININVPTSVTGNDTARGGYTDPRFMTLTNEMSKVDRLRFQNYSTPGANPSARNSESLSVPRFTRRIKESIALFMPSSLVHTSHNLYEEVSLTALGGKVMSVAASAVTGTGGALAGQALNAATGGTAGRIVDAAGKVIGATASLAKYPINPRVEILFSTTPQRQYVFEVLMAPRNEQESQSIEAIIRTLRFHAAPEIGSGTSLGGSVGELVNTVTSGLAGFTFIPPAEFDITFYTRGQENPHIPRINTCVLEKIEIDYSPAGGVYSTFQNGFPVAVRLSMAFREVEILHKLRVLQGF